MKLVIVAVLAVVAVAVAAPPASAPGEPIPIVRSEFDQNPNGGYNYGYETGNGIKAEETGEVKTVNDEENKPHDVVVVRGQYSYVDDEGKTHSVTYTADENGFQAVSDDIPVAARR